MNKDKNGGPAFPSCGADGSGPNGMTLRDWFAGKAMPAAIGDFSRQGVSSSNNSVQMKVTAKLSYQIADAMLAEREKDQHGT